MAMMIIYHRCLTCMKILERHGMHENILIRAHTNFHLLEKTLEHIQIARHSQTDLEKLH